MIALRLENRIKTFIHPYLEFQPPHGKTLQEVAGFSLRPEINETLEKIHSKLKDTSKKFLPAYGGNVLDIGCGPGLYMDDFDKCHKLYGIDISKEMIKIASSRIPHAKFFEGDFLKIQINESFHLIYSIGMLCYISRCDIEKFFSKIHALLLADGILFLSYPHAISKWDLYYPDLSYIQYSPSLIEKIVSEKFEIIEHIHGLDGRIVGKYDVSPYKSLNPGTHRTYKNSYLLIARKR
jgi:SAM-dependent methyltransferase